MSIAACDASANIQAPPPKHLHASLDLISLLHLDGLYNTYVRPYFDPVPETDDEADAAARPRAKKKQGLQKGYVGLLEDCIGTYLARIRPKSRVLALCSSLDYTRARPGALHPVADVLADAPDPVPMGNQAEHSLLPLIPDMLDHEKPPFVSWQGLIVPLTPEALSSARLEPGTRVEGYASGEKLGVREAEERRRRKKASRLSQSVAPDLPDLPGSPAPPAISAPGAAPGAAPAHGMPNPPPPRGPRTPFVPRGGRPSAGTPVRPPFPRASAPPTSGNYTPRPGTPGAAKPGTPARAPGFTLAPNRGTPGTPGGLKRPAPASGEYPNVKRVKGGGSRSASPAMGDVGVKAMFKRRTEEPPE